MKRSATILFSLAFLMTGTPVLVLVPGTALAQDAELEEITVTARKREEALQDIPMSVSSFDGASLEEDGVLSVDDLIGRTPSLFFSQNNSRQSTADNTSLVMRGVGSNAVLDPSVGVFLDGVYIPSLGFDLGLLDVERVEVLRGPQGSLFGRNTPGGALNIVSRKPSEDFRGRTYVEFDDLDSVRAMASVSGPLSGGKAFGALSLGVDNTDGFTTNSFLGVPGNNRDTFSGRLQLRYTPSDATEVVFSVDAINEDGREQGTAISLENGETFNFVNDFDGAMKEDNVGASMMISHELSGATLTSITGYRDISSSRASDVDKIAEGLSATGNEQRTFADQESFSQELRLTSTGMQGMDWIAGIYYYSDDDKYETDIDWDTWFALSPASPPGSGAITSSTQERSGFAIFGQADFAIDIAVLTFGLRYSDDDIDATRFNFITIPEFGYNKTNPNPDDPTATGDASAGFDNVSGTFQAAFNVSEEFKPYVNFSQGYKGGGFDRYPTSSSLYLPFDAEETVNYEVGAKGRLADGQLRYSLAIYKIEIDNLQLPTQIINPDTGLPATAISNAGEASTDGFELEIDYSLNEYVTFDLVYGSTDGEFDVFTDTDGIDRAGDSIPNIPGWTGSLNLRFDKPLSNGRRLTGSVGARFVDDYISGLNTSTDDQHSYDAYSLIDASLGLVYNERLKFSVFVRNFTDEFTPVNKSEGSISAIYGGSLLLARVLQPRVVGIRVAYTWD